LINKRVKSLIQGFQPSFPRQRESISTHGVDNRL